MKQGHRKYNKSVVYTCLTDFKTVSALVLCTLSIVLSYCSVQMAYFGFGSGYIFVVMTIMRIQNQISILHP